MSKDVTGGEREPGCHMAPTAELVTPFLTMKIVINGLCIFFFSNSSVAVSRLISEEQVGGKHQATCETALIRTS